MRSRVFVAIRDRTKHKLFAVDAKVAHTIIAATKSSQAHTSNAIYVLSLNVSLIGNLCFNFKLF